MIGNFDIYPGGDRTGTTPQPERFATNWTIDLIKKGSAIAKAATGRTQRINALSRSDGYASSCCHDTHRVGMDIDLGTDSSTWNPGNGTLSSEEQKVVTHAVSFANAISAAGGVARFITSNDDIYAAIDAADQRCSLGRPVRRPRKPSPHRCRPARLESPASPTSRATSTWTTSSTPRTTSSGARTSTKRSRNPTTPNGEPTSARQSPTAPSQPAPTYDGGGLSTAHNPRACDRDPGPTRLDRRPLRSPPPLPLPSPHISRSEPAAQARMKNPCSRSGFKHGSPSDVHPASIAPSAALDKPHR